MLFSSAQISRRTGTDDGRRLVNCKREALRGVGADTVARGEGDDVDAARTGSRGAGK
jgi:hypothetical protein